jgi:KICSTOR complex protein ITFG2
MDQKDSTIQPKDLNMADEENAISRTVQLTQGLKWKFAGNMYSTAICLGNVDNDEHNDIEFVVGNIKGDVGIFKYSDLERPWREAHELGTITALTIGDVQHQKKNSLLCITAEGMLHIFDILQSNYEEDSIKKSRREKASRVYPSLSLRIPVNSVRVLVADIDEDGENEIIIGRTDRVLHAFRLDSKKELQELQRWQLPGQIGTLSMGTVQVGQVQRRSLVIAQPGSDLIYLTDNREIRARNNSGFRNRELSPLGVSTEIVCDVGKKKRIGYITLDGSLRMEECDGQSLWEIQIDHQLFSLYKCSLMATVQHTNDGAIGTEQLVLCAWDGTTYIVNENKDMLRFQFSDRVCAFMAGNYALHPGKNVPCFFYVTFSDEIYVYCNVNFRSLTNLNFHQFLKNQTMSDALYRIYCISDMSLSASVIKCLLYYNHLYKISGTPK